MRKSDIVAAVVSATGLSRRQADDVVAALLEQITNALSRGESVTLVGFGSFSVKRFKARTGRHPRTGEPLAIGSRSSVGFKPGKVIRSVTCS